MSSSNIVIIAIATVLISNVSCWKPVTGPPTSFSIRQSHPAVGGSTFSSHNAIVDTTGGSEPAVSYHGSSFFEDAADDESPVTASGYDLVKSRIFSNGGFPEDACSVDKYAFDHEGTVHYRHSTPKMEQFTLCLWMRFTNHSGDHTLFTYSVDDEPREIQFWVANSKGSSFISMAVHGQSLYRLNYPLKMRVWHHACSSWNGKTGEWQLWMKAERVGRGFHNRLVGHEIDAHGISFSGGPSITGPTAEGLHFELTLLQLYKVALSAGKAHRDHKHHHVHQFNHDGPAPTTTPAPTQPPPTQPPNPLLANGQIPSRVRINFAGVQPQQQADPQQPQQQQPALPSQVVGGIISNLQQPNLATINTNFVNGQFHTAGRFLSEQLAGVGPSVASSVGIGTVPQTGSLQSSSPVTFPGQQQQVQSLQIPSGVQFIDPSTSTRFLFKRNSATTATKTAATTDNKTVKKREIDDKKVNKRGLVMLDDGSIVDDVLLAHGYQFEGLAQFGLPAFKEDLQKQMDIEDEIREHDREPAEGEVKAVMGVCTSCDVEPFKGAVSMTWKDLRVSLDQSIKGRSVGGCGYF